MKKQNNWEKELLDKFGSDIKRDAMCPLEDFIRQLLKAQREQILGEIIELRDLRPSEKGKSLDYWEGYTSAISEISKKLK